LSQLSSDKLLAGVELNDGAVESACNVRGDDGFEDCGELEGEIRPLYPVLNLGLEGGFENDDCAGANLPECVRLSELEEK
jgi:hypothetical protein